ncbi:amino acid adenylation domain-containing protein [Nonomuraea solani]|uniref:Amino acid adenylation domain-containing protein n=1 Tax=Nonomuraea solani TaxID=1144553 RepID=A0A1H6EX14_9ACTN|nr:non-ribosomal peptide synthetase [Nonomuraea solani]SEH01214.1 amino acid adenylation domain-containing protein [Nonomuraea solani]
MTGAPDRAPLTPSQLGLWFGELWEREVQPDGGAALYHINTSLRVRGPLDAGVLHRALTALLDRHPVLRGHVVPGERPVLEDTGPVVLAMPVVDFSHSPRTALDMARARLAHEVGRPFDLSRGPLLRAALLRLSADDHVLVLVVHHLVCDGLSLRVLYRDLGRLYRVLAAETPADETWEVLFLPTSWFGRDTTVPADREEALRYWEELLRGAPEVIELPADRPRPEGGGSAGRALRRVVPSGLWQRLVGACGRWRVTPYMVVLAAYAVLLARLTGQRDLVIGSPSSGRTSMDDADTIGMFVTTAPLRLRVGAGDTVHDLLGQVRSRVLEAMRYGGVGFEELVDRLQVPRSTVYAPIVQVLCGLDQLDVIAPEFGPGVVAERMATPCTNAKFELGLGVEVTAGEVVADWEYRTDLFDESTVAALADAYLALLESFVADGGDGLVRDLDAGGNGSLLFGPAQPEGPVLPTRVPVPVQIAERAALSPGAIAARTDRGVEVTYRELDDRARSLATRLRRAGAGPEEAVLLALPRGVGWAVAVLGTWYAGAAVVPLDLSLPDQRLRAMTEAAGVRIGLAESPEAAKTIAKRLDIDLDWLDLDGTGGDGAEVPDVQLKALAYVLFTSGSTGLPKPVAVAHDALAFYAGIFAERLAITADDVFLQFSALTFDVCFEETVPVWCLGGSVLLLEDNKIAPVDLERVLADGGGTLADFTSSYWAEWARDLERRPRPLPPALRTVVIGAEAGYVADLKRWSERTNVPVVNAYGLTETLITSITHTGSVSDGRLGPVVPIGLPMRGMRGYVLDTELWPVAPGLAGELYVAGPALAREYPGLPAATAERFLPDPFAGVAGARMYRTGDRAKVDADGVLRFVGRVDGQIKVRGHRVELREVEVAVAAHPDVEEVVARAVRTEGSHEVIAYVVARPGGTLDTDDLRRFLVQRIPGYQVPAYLVELAELPRTAGGKLVPSALPEPVRGPRPEAAPVDATQAALLRIWWEVLGRDDVSADDNFFAVGGNSISSIRMVSLARAAGMPFTVRDVFAHQSVRELAEAFGAAWAPQVSAGDLRETPVGSHRPISREFRLPDTAHLGIEGASRAALLAGVIDAERIEPAGPMQRWGLNRLRNQPRPGMYRVYEAFDVTGAGVDVDALVLAWNALVEHHPALRTSLRTHDGVDLRVVHRNAALPVRRVDLRGHGTAGAVLALDRYLSTVRSSPADPLRRCQVELTVFDLGDGAAYLVWDYCYLNLDGWSFSALLRDLFDLHDGFRAGEPVTLAARPELGTIRQESDLAAARSYWTGRLAGAPHRLLGADGVAGSSGRAHADQRAWLPAERTALLNQRAAEAGVTLHTLVQGAYAIALGHALATGDLVFGTVVSGRADTDDGQDAVGCLNNRLPCRVVIDGAATCADWLRGLQADHADATRYEHVSPLDVQRWCGIDDADRLYDTEIVVENFPFDGRLQSRLASWNPIANGSPGDETLRLVVWPDPALLLKVSHYREHVSDERAVHLLHHVRRVLDTLADGLDRPVASIQLEIQLDEECS